MAYKNKEDAVAYGRWYRKENHDKDLLSKEKWRKENSDIQRIMVANWAKENKGRIKENNAARYVRDKERISARNAKYRKENQEASRALVHRRRARKTKAGGSYTAVEWKNLCKKYNNRCLCCGKKRKLTPDHVIPIAKGGTSNIHNIQPLCMPCNAKKHTGTQDFRSTLN